MSRLMRMTYGHSGTRMERIIVTAPPGGPVPAPSRLRFLLLAVWLIIPILVGRFALPTAPQQTTVIDTSLMEVTPPPPVQELPQSRQREPVMQPEPREENIPERPPAEPPPPAITRPAPHASEAMESQPRISRERVRTREEAALPAVPHARRAAATADASADRMTIARSRSGVSAELPAGTERVAPLRRSRTSEGTPTGAAPELRPITRSERHAIPGEGPLQRNAATRDRAAVTGAAEVGSSPLSLSREISFASLDICASSQEEEDRITALMGIVGSRQSCRDTSGEYRFKGTRRISSFNLVILPAKGRKPTNRCEELENAYRCLKNH